MFSLGNGFIIVCKWEKSFEKFNIYINPKLKFHYFSFTPINYFLNRIISREKMSQNSLSIYIYLKKPNKISILMNMIID